MHILWFNLALVMCVFFCGDSGQPQPLLLLLVKCILCIKYLIVYQNKKGSGLIKTKKYQKETTFDIMKHATTGTSIGVKFNI